MPEDPTLKFVVRGHLLSNFYTQQCGAASQCCGVGARFQDSNLFIFLVLDPIFIIKKSDSLIFHTTKVRFVAGL